MGLDQFTFLDEEKSCNFVYMCMYVSLSLKASKFEVIRTVTKMKGKYTHTHTHKSLKGKFIRIAQRIS